MRPAILGSRWGRIATGAASAKLLVASTGLLLEPAGFLQGVDAIATAALVLVAIVLLARQIGSLWRRLLWRVRRKLILSYVFIGLVPATLIVLFFVGAGLLTFLNLSSYLLNSGLERLTDEVQLVAQEIAIEAARETESDARARVLDEHQDALERRWPEVSIAIVPIGVASPGDAAPPVEPSAVVGPWWHLEPPTTLPAWVSRGGFAGLVAYRLPDGGDTLLTVRAAGLPGTRDQTFAVIVDVPIDDQVVEDLRARTGIELQSIGLVPVAGDAVQPQEGRRRDATEMVGRTRGSRSSYTVSWVTFADFTDWATGRAGTVGVSTNVSVGDLWTEISQSQKRLGNINLGELFLLALALTGGLFLVFEAIAFVIGFLLARSITSSLHELFVGTERVRTGDLSHRIRMKGNDQMGELASSFNSMTTSIEDLLLQADEKKRLEEELRIARKVQMSLLPFEPLDMVGLAMTTVCVPAREVGGDYFDFFRLSDHRVGLLIADVSGKGTSAAFYMAELKGLMLSLSRIHDSPRALLIDVNRILARSLDNSSFITMTYAILDMDTRTMVYARAGHTPLIHLSAGASGRPESRVLLPDGMVVGLHLDGIEQIFSDVLEEQSLSIAPGDVLVFFTDGISEAMNAESHLFGEDRLSQLVEDHGGLSSEDLRERILRDVESFVDGADQHDDMTMIVLKVLDVGTPSAEADARVAVAV